LMRRSRPMLTRLRAGLSGLVMETYTLVETWWWEFVSDSVSFPPVADNTGASMQVYRDVSKRADDDILRGICGRVFGFFGDRRCKVRCGKVWRGWRRVVVYDVLYKLIFFPHHCLRYLRHPWLCPACSRRRRLSMLARFRNLRRISFSAMVGMPCSTSALCTCFTASIFPLIGTSFQ
jgi:hypothetical protein